MDLKKQAKKLCISVGLILLSLAKVYSFGTATNLNVIHMGAGYSLIHSTIHARFLLLPIEEAVAESKLNVIVNNIVIKTINVRLAVSKVDYYVPIDLTEYNDKALIFSFQNVPESAICWKGIKMSDEFNTKNTDAYRPVYHFTPLYGWMNDPNGLIYKDGEYHLFYQYNPYGSMWGNMHWGHAVSKDLINWEHLPVAIAPDALGSIFSGSCVVDKDNTSGFGADAIIAIYTSAGERQTQCLAYSLDNGRTFEKYDMNPILTSTANDFRDPKVFWYKESKKWIMVLAVGQEIQFYSSSNLKSWQYESSFGHGEGAHAGVWECPDLIELPVKGSKMKKWVFMCNLNPGGPFGGSATQYFVGTFDGHKFVNESPETTKWMDWGKDHYATVTWSNAPQGRAIALAWMSNWEYANNVPSMQFRSANSVPRELSLYTEHGKTYLSNNPVKELLRLRIGKENMGSFKVSELHHIEELLANNVGSYEMELSFKNNNANIFGFQLLNKQGEKVDIKYSLNEGKLIMDRRYSGKVDFSKTFATSTWAPIHNEGKEYSLRIFVDKSSIEIFDGNGKFVMTNLVFPSEPYNSINFYTEGGSYSVTSFTTYKLGLKN